MSLSLTTHVLPDPDGHGAALALQGDWVVVVIDDGTHAGLGEASHSGNDEACRNRCAELFNQFVISAEPSLATIRLLQDGAFSTAPDFVTATAISALDQALHDLVARREGVPVWKLVRGQPERTKVPVYVTLNRALTSRDHDDYRDAVRRVLEMGVPRVKVAPFEAVTPGGDQLIEAERGFAVLRMLRETFPDLGIRLDCHERFTPENALALLPKFDALGLEWIEVPCPIGPTNSEIRERTMTPLAAGEFFFGTEDFLAMCERGWADVVMPDVKHAGGFGPLLQVCDVVAPFSVRVSPHNPSGAVSTLASLHAASIAGNAGELELPLHGRGHVPAYRSLLHEGALHLPSGPGWGFTLEEILEGGGAGGLR